MVSELPTSPLLVHASYSRIEIQAALGDGSGAVVPTWREGVRWFAHDQVDAFLVTINKASGSFSPTTAYRDFALSRELFHWESQSTTSDREFLCRWRSRGGSPTRSSLRCSPEYAAVAVA